MVLGIKRDRERKSSSILLRDPREYPELSVQFDMPRTAVGEGKPNIICNLQ